MNRQFARAEFFDASALVCLHVPDRGFEAVRAYFESRAAVYTTAFCFYEALSILKTKTRRKVDNPLTKEQYLHAAHELTIWFMGMSKVLPEIDLIDREHYGRVREVANQYDLDYSDALQIVSVKHGRYSNLINESATVLTTVDVSLARAARAEGLKVWSVLEGPAPE